MTRETYDLETGTTTFLNTADGVEATVTPRADGSFAFTLTDVDSGIVLPMVRAYATEAEAVAYAERCVE